MSDYIKEFEFEKEPKEITYIKGEPLKLNKEFVFFHNKNLFRKELTRLQYLFKSYTNIPLIASGIRDSYLKDEFSQKNLIVIFTTNEVIKETNQIIKNNSNLEINSNCFFLEATSTYMLLLAKDLKGLILGLDTMELVIKQVMDEYFNQKKFDEYIKIRPFKLYNC